MSVLVFDDVRKSYGDTIALRGVSFEVRQAEVFGLLGPNGAGKTTLIRILMDILRPAVRSVIRLVISEYAVMDVYSAQRAANQEEITAKVKALVEHDGFLVDEIVLRDVRFTDAFAAAIEAKQIAQQAAEQMRYVLEKEHREAERKVIEAEGRGKAIETVSAALRGNPDYVRYLYVDKLSDKIAVIVSDQSTIMDLKGVLDARGR